MTIYIITCFQEKMPYTTLEIVQNAIKASAKAERFFYDCKLNNPDKKILVCTDKCDGFTMEEIKEYHGLTIDQVKIFTSKCDLCKLTRFDRLSMCRRKRKGESLQEVYEEYIGRYSKDQVKGVYDNC